MKISIGDLLACLESVSPGLAKQEVIEQSTSFIFSEGWIYTYNDEIFMACPAPEGLELEGVIQSKELLSVLGKAKSETATLKVVNNELTISSGKMKSGIILEAEIQLPFLQPPEDAEWRAVPEKLAEGLRLCAFSAASPNVSAVLSSVHVCEDFVESCDNFRITRYDLGESIDGELLIQASAINSLGKYDLNKYVVHEGWIHFENEETGLMFACRTFDEQFPDLESFMVVEGDPVQLPDELKEVLDRVGVFSTDDSGTDLVEIDIKNKVCVVRSENIRGWMTEKVSLKSTIELNFKISPSVLKDILSISHKAIMGETAIQFKAENFNHVISLTVS